MKTGGQAFTNLDSDQIYGRGNIGPSQCTVIPLEILKDSLRKRILHTFGYDILESFSLNEAVNTQASQEFPYEQSTGKETIRVCEFCEFTCRDIMEFNSHQKEEHAVCDICGKRVKNQEELSSHKSVH